MKIVNLKKFIRSLFLIFALIFIISLFVTKTSLSYTKKEFKIVYVESGDTLWSIACKLQNSDYYNGKDIRYIINDIKAWNNLINSNLYYNQELKIPII